MWFCALISFKPCDEFLEIVFRKHPAALWFFLDLRNVFICMVFSLNQKEFSFNR